MDKLSYALGLNIGHQLREMGMKGKLIASDFAAAVNDVIEGNPIQINDNEAQTILNNFFTEMEKKQQEAAAAAGKAAKTEGEAFLAENSKKERIITTPSGLQYEILKEGNGRNPKATDTVRCHYHGTLIDGTVFDSSYQRGEPAAFGLNQVIAGWTEGVQLMKEGAKYRFYIPYNLAYGERGAGGAIPPYSALIFDVELLEIL
ncbi:MAG: FKBP-type peptidyl-prolyl cis-trans isomerase [Bacteroidales bacterium]|nr:FKBP-type peptidyl-prolyl cis-trans isomerase [Bacteroidales bacterium]